MFACRRPRMFSRLLSSLVVVAPPSARLPSARGGPKPERGRAERRRLIVESAVVATAASRQRAEQQAGSRTGSQDVVGSRLFCFLFWVVPYLVLFPPII